METMTETWLKALDKAATAHHYEAIRDAGVRLADTILNLADAQVDAANDKAPIERARSLLHDWPATARHQRFRLRICCSRSVSRSTQWSCRAVTAALALRSSRSCVSWV